MAEVNFFDHFELPWAKNGVVEGISDSQWQAGWSFIGATPPSVEQFNKLQQISDQKSAWLYRQFKFAAERFGHSPGPESTDAMVRVLGNHSGVVVTRQPVALAADQAGQLIVVAESVQVTLPSLSSCPLGATFRIVATAVATIRTVGGDLIQFNGIESSSVQTVSFSGGDSITLVNIGTTWYAVDGTAQMRYAETFRASRNASGYQVLPSGLIFQWSGVTVGANQTATLSFPIAFPNAALNIVGSRRVGTNATFNFEAISSTQYRAQNLAPATEVGNWIAIGH